MKFSDSDWHAAFETAPSDVDLAQMAEWQAELSRLAGGLASLKAIDHPGVISRIRDLMHLIARDGGSRK